MGGLLALLVAAAGNMAGQQVAKDVFGVGKDANTGGRGAGARRRGGKRKDPMEAFRENLALQMQEQENAKAAQQGGGQVASPSVLQNLPSVQQGQLPQVPQQASPLQFLIGRSLAGIGRY